MCLTYFQMSQFNIVTCITLTYQSDVCWYIFTFTSTAQLQVPCIGLLLRHMFSPCIVWIMFHFTTSRLSFSANQDVSTAKTFFYYWIYTDLLTGAIVFLLTCILCISCIFAIHSSCHGIQLNKFNSHVLCIDFVSKWHAYNYL